ncbi:hypothetical protein LEM8419_02314 [Neolewinella maritima]|uniref:Glycosyltransferase RgtA/B/C/D-like domain-containing protein n=1 Tax=Neolewinella maritima TaxID=1383882 RepID=A0ABN8F362_9BACT|nr:hypothetical protein [Neolewinella maritima]CAH1001411.1 hypothetical protein LEM8419_02314 [Neolewinella maritima]
MHPASPRSRSIPRLAYGLAVLFFLSNIVYAAWYLSQDYTTLRDAYLATGPFYRDAFWTTDFFTPSTKAAGDRFAAVAILLAVAVLVYLGYCWRHAEQRAAPAIRVPVKRDDILPLLCLATVQLGLWVYGNQLLPPAYDEVFSAMHAAAPGPLRALTYYMLPNNHVLFNVLNGTLFGWADDLVFTGRLISLLAYLLLGVLQYVWLRSLLSDRLAALALTLFLAVLLPVWGFAVQARGYALLLLFSWGAFLAVWQYVSGRGRGMRWVFAGCCVLAYATVPVFLYLHLALLIWIVRDWIRRRRIDWQLIATQLVAGVAVLLVYLPAITYSGLGAMVDNRYVAAGEEGGVAFARMFLPTLPHYVNYLALDIGSVLPYLLPLLALLPLLLVFAQRVLLRRLAIIYLIVLCSTIGTVLVMRAVPFHRTLVFQLQFVGLLIACIPLAAWEWTVGSKLPRRWLRLVAVGWLLLAGALIWLTPAKFSLHLYYYDIVPTYQSMTTLLDQLPTDAKVAGSDEAFYPLYFIQSDGEVLPSAATYYVKRPTEPLPEGRWELVGQDREFEVYRRE